MIASYKGHVSVMFLDRNTCQVPYEKYNFHKTEIKKGQAFLSVLIDRAAIPVLFEQRRKSQKM